MNKKNSGPRRIAWAFAAAGAIAFILGIIRMFSMDPVEWRILLEFFIATTLAGFSITFFRYED
ncbi:MULTISPECIES: hypothetical protein [unclassified Corynebacterium]|jgi:hypothetical protein|uniref:hypothetical protein n=1 Tax=unclassified Corynebacterium TaxID=2624378 RepID=UPI00255115AC|nr:MULTISPECIES: hypothetical protein [unclassified Corynebacterium]MDK8659794.1 hypothetical protein [Corynebacterium sp. MSK204]MDK8815698.1 hypothetical protein [Corynebacterium sp. MSK073]